LKRKLKNKTAHHRKRLRIQKLYTNKKIKTALKHLFMVTSAHLWK